MGDDMLIDLAAGPELQLLSGVIEQHSDLGGLVVDPVDRPGVEDGHVVE